MAPKLDKEAAGFSGCLVALLFPVVLGGIGFFCGFLGPIVLTPNANQGPLLGIFITGPLAVLVGLVLAGLLLARHATSKTIVRVFFTSAILIGLLTLLWAASPRWEDRLHAEILDAEILSCEQPSALISQAKARWLDEERKGIAFCFRPGWQKDDESIKNTAAEDKGVVATLHVYRVIHIFESKKPWDSGTLYAKPLPEKEVEVYSTGKYFIWYKEDPGEVCKPGVRRLFYCRLSQPYVESNPPTYLPQYLFIYMELEDVPKEYRPFADGTMKRF